MPDFYDPHLVFFILSLRFPFSCNPRPPDMDPVTAAGLLAAILQLVGATANAISYVNDIKDAPAERAQFAREASSLLALLTDLRYLIDESESETDA